MEQAFYVKIYQDRVISMLLKYITRKHQNNSLLDLSFDFTNDYYKWTRYKIKKVVSLNANLPHVIEAIRRFSNKQLDYKYYHIRIGDLYTKTLLIKSEMFTKFDNINLKYSLNYYFKNENLMTLFQDLKNRIKPGGHIIGCFLNIDVIKTLLKDEDTFTNDIMTIKLLENDKLHLIYSGNLYCYSLIWQVVNVIDTNGLLNAAYKNNFELKFWKPIVELSKKTMKLYNHINDTHMQYLSCFTCFIFQSK